MYDLSLSEKKYINLQFPRISFVFGEIKESSYGALWWDFFKKSSL